MDKSIVLETRSLSKSVTMGEQKLEILSDINLRISRGGSLAIVGESGSGKSTLLGLLAGLDVPTTGEIHLLGKQLNLLNEDSRAQVRAQHVGFVFQNFQLLANLTALENVMLPLEIASGENIKNRAQDILGRVGLSHRINHYPNQLSGGEQQRVAIARAFVTAPQILFADEPTGNLDTQTGGLIANQLFELNTTTNTTLVLVTHDHKLAERCASQITIHGGKII